MLPRCEMLTYLLIVLALHRIKGKLSDYKSPWIRDDSCVHLKYYSDIDALLENNHHFLGDNYYGVNYSSTPEERRKNLKVVHLCTPDELLEFGVPPVKQLRYKYVTLSKLKHVWENVYRLLANKTVGFIGDSLIYQHAVALHLFLARELNITCSADVFPNGLKMYRPFLTTIPNDITAIQTLIEQYDIVFVNTGAHYGLSKKTAIKRYEEALTRLFQVMQSERNRHKTIWLDTLVPHFQANGGSYQHYLRKAKEHSGHKPHSCVPLVDEGLANVTVLNTHNRVSDGLLNKFPDVTNIRTYDLFAERFDAHQSYLTSRVKSVVSISSLFRLLFVALLCFTS
jgi:hypothetical protein